MEQLKLGTALIGEQNPETHKFEHELFVLKMAAESLGFDTERIDVSAMDSNKKKDGNSPKIILLIAEKWDDHILEFVEEKVYKEQPIPIVVFSKPSRRNKHAPGNLFIVNEPYTDSESLYEKAQKRLIEFNNSRKADTAKILNKKDSNIYKLSKEFIKRASHRVIVCQNSSTLILGARNKDSYEIEFLDAIETFSKKGNAEFTHIFSISDTKKSLNDNQYETGEAKRALQTFLETVKCTCRFALLKEKIVPFVVADYNLLFRLQLGNQVYNVELPKSISDPTTFYESLKEIQAAKICSSQDVFTFEPNMTIEERKEKIQQLTLRIYQS